MKRLIAIFAFSILFLAPIGYQEVFAGIGQCVSGENIDPPTSASPGTPTSPPQCIPETNSWEVGSDSEPVPISFDPDAGPWVKHLPYPQGLGAVQESLVEDLIVAPDVAWDDWHEEIQPGSNWEFISATITTSAGHNIVVPGLSVATGSNQIWVDFVPALQPGTTVHIEKMLQHIGPPDSGVIEIWEFPTVKEVQRVVAGEIIPLESTSLLLSGMQTNFSWIIPALVIAAGASAFLIKRKND